MLDAIGMRDAHELGTRILKLCEEAGMKSGCDLSLALLSAACTVGAVGSDLGQSKNWAGIAEGLFVYYARMHALHKKRLGDA